MMFVSLNPSNTPLGLKLSVPDLNTLSREFGHFFNFTPHLLIFSGDFQSPLSSSTSFKLSSNPLPVLLTQDSHLYSPTQQQVSGPKPTNSLSISQIKTHFKFVLDHSSRDSFHPPISFCFGSFKNSTFLSSNIGNAVCILKSLVSDSSPTITSYPLPPESLETMNVGYSIDPMCPIESYSSNSSFGPYFLLLNSDGIVFGSNLLQLAVSRKNSIDSNGTGPMVIEENDKHSTIQSQNLWEIDSQKKCSLSSAEAQYFNSIIDSRKIPNGDSADLPNISVSDENSPSMIEEPDLNFNPESNPSVIRRDSDNFLCNSNIQFSPQYMNISSNDSKLPDSQSKSQNDERPVSQLTVIDTYFQSKSEHPEKSPKATTDPHSTHSRESQTHSQLDLLTLMQSFITIQSSIHGSLDALESRINKRLDKIEKQIENFSNQSQNIASVRLVEQFLNVIQSRNHSVPHLHSFDNSHPPKIDPQLQASDFLNDRDSVNPAKFNISGLENMMASQKYDADDIDTKQNSSFGPVHSNHDDVSTSFELNSSLYEVPLSQLNSSFLGGQDEEEDVNSKQTEPHDTEVRPVSNWSIKRQGDELDPRISLFSIESYSEEALPSQILEGQQRENLPKDDSRSLNKLVAQIRYRNPKILRDSAEASQLPTLYFNHINTLSSSHPQALNSTPIVGASKHPDQLNSVTQQTPGSTSGLPKLLPNKTPEEFLVQDPGLENTCSSETPRDSSHPKPIDNLLEHVSNVYHISPHPQNIDFTKLHYQYD